MEDDLNYLVENEFSFPEILEENKKKYTFEMANLDSAIFDSITTYLKSISRHFQEILNEIYNHRDLTILKIKRTIDEKVKNIMKLAESKPQEI